LRIFGEKAEFYGFWGKCPEKARKIRVFLDTDVKMAFHSSIVVIMDNYYKTGTA
jgi:hypothetical protein